MAVPEGPVVVIGDALHQVEHRPRQAAHWPVPVVPHSHVQVPHVEVLKILIKRDKILQPDRVTEAAVRPVFGPMYSSACLILPAGSNEFWDGKTQECKQCPISMSVS